MVHGLEFEVCGVEGLVRV